MKNRLGAVLRAFSAHFLAWLELGMGVLYLWWGQRMISYPGDASFPLSQWLNETFRLEITNLDTVLVGLPFLGVGCFALVHLLVRRQVLGGEKEAGPPLAGEAPARFPRRNLAWGMGGGLLGALLLAFLANGQYNDVLPWVWLAAPCLCAVLAWKWDRHTGVRLSPHIRRLDLIWMTGLLLLGLVILTYRLQDVPNQMMGDEGNFWTTARDIATGKYQPPIFGLGGYDFGVLSSILQGLTLRLFGISFWSWRFSSVLAGMAAIPPLYLLSRELFDRKVAVVSCLALLTAPYFLAFTRLGYNNIQVVAIVTLALYFFYLGTLRHSAFYFFLGGCVAGLGIYTYTAAMGAFYVMLLFLGGLLLRSPRQCRWVGKAGLVIAVGWFLVSSPATVYVNSTTPSRLRSKPLESAFFNTFYGDAVFKDAPAYLSAARFKIDRYELFYAPDLYAILLTRGVIRTLLAFNSPYVVIEHFISGPLTGPVAVLFYLVGSFFALAQVRQKRYLLLMLWLGFNVLVFGILNTYPPRQTHLVGIIPVIAIFIGVGIVAWVDLLADLFPRLKGRAQSWLLNGVVIVIALSGLHNFFVAMPEQYLPSVEQVMNWNALYANGQSFYYLYDPTERPDFKPYSLREIRPDVPYQAIPVSAFMAHPEQYPLPQNALIFYSYLSDPAPNVLQALLKQYGYQSHQITMFDAEGWPLGRMAWVGEQPKVLPSGLLETLRDSYNRPSAWLFVPLAALLLGCVFFRGTWLKRPAAWLTRIGQKAAEKGSFQ